MLKENTKAADFLGTDQNGQKVSLSKLLEDTKFLLLYFYPKDDTPGCTVEASAMRDMMTELDNAGIKVVGVSADSVESHQEFIKKYQLNYTLLADTDRVIINLYQALGQNDLANRVSYLINQSGWIIKCYEDVDPQTHTEQILSDINNF